MECSSKCGMVGNCKAFDSSEEDESKSESFMLDACFVSKFG